MHGRRGWNRIRSIHGVIPALLVGGAAACWCGATVAADKAPAPRRPLIDPAVVQAGGACRGCRDPQCHTCRHGGLHRHHHGCREGACHPHCPVRPQEFGFYGTQWRRWPGQGVVPASNLQEATPTRPPKSAVPGPDEESRGPRAGELPAPDVEEPSTVEPPAAEPSEPAAAPEPEPAKLPPAEPAARPVEEEPVAPAPPPAEPPAKVPPATKPEGDDLFDESATGPVRRRFVAGRPAAPAVERPQSAVRPAALVRPSPTPPAAQPASAAEDGPRVPRVPFDPAVEAARLRR